MMVCFIYTCITLKYLTVHETKISVLRNFQVDQIASAAFFPVYLETGKSFWT
jgi:hypothetical protein